MAHRRFSGILMVTLALTVRCASGDIPRSEDGFNFLSYSVMGGVGYQFSITHDALEKSVWDEGDCPRCSPKRAKVLAREWINKNTPLKDTKEFEWECISIRLVHVHGDVWFWIVDHEYNIKVGGSGIPQSFSVAVLADGTIPNVKKVKPRVRE